MTLKNNKGLTLIECLISILLLAIILAGGISLYTYSTEVVTLATNKKISTEMAHNKLEELRSISYSNPQLDPGSHTDNPVVLGGLNASVVHVVTQPNTAYKNVNVTVTWTESGKAGSRTVSFDTIIAP